MAAPSRYENLIVYGNQLGIRTGMNNEFVNCTVVNNSGLGIWSLSSNFSLTNCIVAGNTEGQVRFRNADSPSQITVNYSNIEGLESGIDVNNNGTLTWGQGNINVAPKFVDAENGDYNLLASSMLINAGHPDSTDSDGTRSDVGAYSYYNTYSGPTWYVKTNGSDLTGKGSFEDPFGSIQSAINFSDTGDSVSVLAGTFYEHINTKGKNIDIVGQGPGVSIIDGFNSGRVVDISGAMYFAGFTVQNGNGANQYQNQDRGGGMLISDGNDGGATIENCLFTDNINASNGSHVKVGTGAPSTFINCSFKNGAPYTPIFTDNGSKGAIFINCFIDADGAYDAVTSNGYPTFINCTVVNYTGVAYTSHGTGTAGIINSVFQPANGFPDAKVAHAENVENIDIIIDYSIFPEDGINHSTETGSVTYGENNITGYPVFVDTTTNNYRLGDLSPAISAGTSSFIIDGVNYNSPTNDLEGNMRPNPSGSNPDMGAYESDREWIQTIMVLYGMWTDLQTFLMGMEDLGRHLIP